MESTAMTDTATTTEITRSTRTHSFLYGNERVTLQIREFQRFTRHNLGCDWSGVWVVSGMDFRRFSKGAISDCLPSDMALGGDWGEYAHLRRVGEKYMVIRYGGQDDGSP